MTLSTTTLILVFTNQHTLLNLWAMPQIYSFVSVVFVCYVQLLILKNIMSKKPNIFIHYKNTYNKSSSCCFNCFWAIKDSLPQNIFIFLSMCRAKSSWLPSMYGAKSSLLHSMCGAMTANIFRTWNGAMQT